MYPVLLRLGPLKVYSYGLMIAVGFLTALYLVQRDASKRGMDPKVFADMAFLLLPIGIIGTRIAHIIMFPEAYSWRDPVGWIAIWRGGLVFQGALPVTIAFAYYYLKKHNISFLPACDVLFPYAPLAHAFGRVGCFMYGCCYGAPTEVPWGIPARRVPWDISESATGSPAYLDHLNRFSDVTTADHWSHPIHPTQLYSVAGLLAICGLMLLLRKRWNPFSGFTLPVYLVIYGGFRFLVEFFRGDGNPVRYFGLTDQQVFSVFFALLGVVLFYVLRSRQATKAAHSASKT